MALKRSMKIDHLKALRRLTQFERCWAVIDSHLELYEQSEKPEQKPKTDRMNNGTDPDTAI